MAKRNFFPEGVFNLIDADEGNRKRLKEERMERTYGLRRGPKMKYFIMLALLGTCLVGAPNAKAQVAVGVGVGPGYGAAPVCQWGYYGYAPYACAPYGYYGPSWFNGGLFIGAGPWFRGGYGYRGYGYRAGYRGGYGRAYAGGRGFAGGRG